jgi:Novel STAND NTPase 1
VRAWPTSSSATEYRAGTRCKTLTLREVPQAEAAAEAPEAALLDALLQARILIARADADGRPTVRLAHDAVLMGWPRASEAAQASREFYRVRASV